MFSHETFHVQMCAVMEALVEAAVVEMRRLLEQWNTCCLSLDTQEEDTGTGTQQLKAMTSQFASLMETWTKGVVEKLALMLKISMSEEVHPCPAPKKRSMSEEVHPCPAPKKRGGVKYKSSRKMAKQRAGTMNGDKKCEGPDVTREDEDEDSRSRHFVFVIPVWPEQGKIQVEVAAASQPLTEKDAAASQPPTTIKDNDTRKKKKKKKTEKNAAVSQPPTEKELQATRVEEETQGEIHTEFQPSNEEEELQETQPVSELNGKDVSDLDVADVDIADLDADLTCTTQESTADADKNKKKIGPIKCPCCERTFALKGLFARHYLFHTKPHLCSECGKRFARPESLAAHSRKHTGEKIFSCAECGTGFAYRSTYHRHMHQHTCKKTQLCTQTCTFCEAEFPGKFEFQRHKCSALEKTFRCSLCARTFECRQSLADHENLHSGERDYVCEMCGERFFSSSSLSTHRVTHLQQLGEKTTSTRQLGKRTEKKLFVCDVCGKSCSHKSALILHTRKHTGERPYACETCGKRCVHASALQNHMRVHTGQKPGQRPVCDLCGKTFRSMTNLKYHMSVHTGDKPYSCDQCGKKFANPTNLATHRRTHTGEKLYGCNICGQRFTTAIGLKGHSYIHTGEWPFQCHICDKKYRQRGELNKHLKVHLPPQ